MLVVTPLSAAAAGYFLHGPAAGEWVGAAAGALSLDGPVEGLALRRVLTGRHPSTGRSLLLRRPAHRRDGWDLTFAAPKSVSLLAALAAPVDGDLLVGAHAAAVGDALGWLVQHGCRVRLDGRSDPSASPIAARWEHRASDGGDPHVHTHVIVANLARSGDGRWAPLASSPLWPTLRPLGGVYRHALRARLTGAGFAFDWRSLPGSSADGLVELAAVPPAAVASASGRRHRVASTIAGWDDPEVAGRPARRAVRAASRGQGVDGRVDAGWTARVRAAGLDGGRAAAICRAARLGVSSTRSHDDADTAARVTAWLGQRSTSFTGLDVACAALATHDGGMLPDELDRWVARFCADAAPYEPGRRWTTEVAAQEVATVVRAARAHHLGAAVGRMSPGGDAGVVVLAGEPGRSRLVDQATVLAGERRAWEAAGHAVGLIAPVQAWRRWDALAGLRPAGGDRPGLLVVDRADRRSTTELSTILAGAAAGGARVILVEGGTLPARRYPVSGALVELRDAPSRSHLQLPERRDACWLGVVTLADVPVAVGLGPRDAIGALVERWGSAPADRRPMLVGLGPAEVEALNAAARRRLLAEGRLTGPALGAAGRTYQTGDRVMALRRLGVASGTYGTVRSVDPGGSQMLVAWPDGVALVDRHDARRLGHGYAAGPSRLPPGAGEVLLLGDTRTVRDLPARVVGVALVAPTGRRREEVSLDRLVEHVGPPDPAAVIEAARRGTDALERDRRDLGARLRAAGPPQPAVGAERQPTLDWLARHGSELLAWRVAGEALALRADALARVSELQPGPGDRRFDPPRGAEPPPRQPALPALGPERGLAGRAGRDPDLGLGIM